MKHPDPPRLYVSPQSVRSAKDALEVLARFAPKPAPRHTAASRLREFDERHVRRDKEKR
jgi:hypothetical protein